MWRGCVRPVHCGPTSSCRVRFHGIGVGIPTMHRLGSLLHTEDVRLSTEMTAKYLPRNTHTAVVVNNKRRSCDAGQNSFSPNHNCCNLFQHVCVHTSCFCCLAFCSTCCIRVGSFGYVSRLYV